MPGIGLGSWGRGGGLVGGGGVRLRLGAPETLPVFI